MRLSKKVIRACLCLSWFFAQAKAQNLDALFGAPTQNRSTEANSQVLKSANAADGELNGKIDRANQSLDAVKTTNRQMENDSHNLNADAFSLKHDSGDSYKFLCKGNFAGYVYQKSGGDWVGTWADGVREKTWLKAAMKIGKYKYDCQYH